MHLARFLPLAVLAGVLACTPPTRQDVDVAQQMTDMADAMNALRQEQVFMADQIDSLRLVVLRQDSTIRTLANLAGVQVPR
jgi:hypothetical protein